MKTRTFTALVPNSGTRINRCNELLSNQMQCLRAGEYEMMVTDDVTGEVTENYQVCLRHKMILIGKDITAAALTAKIQADQQAIESKEADIADIKTETEG